MKHPFSIKGRGHFNNWFICYIIITKGKKSIGKTKEDFKLIHSRNEFYNSNSGGIPMLMTNFLQQRRSSREFQDRTLGRDKLELSKKIIEGLEAEKENAQIFFRLYENGTPIYDGLKGKAGYSGTMIKAPIYVAMGLKDDEPLTKLQAGYALEKFNSKISNEGVKTCWVTVTQVAPEVKKAIFGEMGEHVSYVIAMGLPKEQKLFTPEVVSARKPIDEFVYSGSFRKVAKADELENLGLFDLFSSIRFAPSHRNSQPWVFVIKDSEVYIYTINNREVKRNLVDLGVIMYYFEEMLKEFGASNKWEILPFEEEEEGYLQVAKIRL